VKSYGSNGGPLKNLGNTSLSSKSVLQSASGLQGEQPLVNKINVGEGSRQNGSVTSG